MRKAVQRSYTARRTKKKKNNPKKQNKKNLHASLKCLEKKRLDCERPWRTTALTPIPLIFFSFFFATSPRSLFHFKLIFCVYRGFPSVQRLHSEAKAFFG